MEMKLKGGEDPGDHGTAMLSLKIKHRHTLTDKDNTAALDGEEDYL